MTQESFPLWVGGEEVPNERTLLTRVESGRMMNGADSVRFLIVHCSATRCDQAYTAEQMLRDHRKRGFRTIGYHFYIRKDGTLTQHRRLLEDEGGLDASGCPADTRTPAQRQRLTELLWKLRRLFPEAQVAGHRDLPGVKKDCPCFDVKELGSGSG